LQPWSKGGLSVPRNLYPSCARCNGLLRALSFDSIEEKREYVRATLIERHQWKPGQLESETLLSDVPGAFREDAEASTLLQSSLPEEGMGTGQGKHRDLSDLPNGVRAQATASGVLQPEMPLARLAKSKSGKHDRTCKTCLKRFTPREKRQRFCDKVCAEDMGRSHDRLADRLQRLIDLKLQRLSERMGREIIRCAVPIVEKRMVELSARLRQIVREELREFSGSA
jgi:hypothetical protein